MKIMMWITLSSVLLVTSTVCWAQQRGQVMSQQVQVQSAPEFVWKQSLPIRSGNPRILAIGGTELRALVVFDNKLFAANGYWEDTEKENPALPGAQVLRLDGLGSAWQVDLELNDRTPGGLRLYLAISTIEKVRFTTDSAGRRLAEPLDILLASVWKRGPGLDVFSRVGSGRWSKTPIPGPEAALIYKGVPIDLMQK